MKMQLSASVVTVLSVVLTAGVVGNAFYNKKQFYPSVVYITKSNPSMAVLYIQALVFVLLVGKIMKRIFFGQLRAAESEHLMEKAWYAVTETCLAFTVFRDDFSPRFVAQFTLLFFLKCFHWLTDERVDYMERSPVITLTFHARLMGIMCLLSSLDSYFVSHAYFTTLLRGASAQIVFGFEYALLMTIVFHVAIKYILHSIDLRNAHPWEGKAVYLLYSELVIGGVRCLLFTVFVGVMIKLHTFPLFSIRPFYMAVRAFKKAVHDVVMSRRAIHAMNTMFADATAEDLTSADNVCIICREEMTAGAKKLPCAHIFHANCLRSWFQRQQSCPTCRSDVLTARAQAGAARPAAPPAAAPAAGPAAAPAAAPGAAPQPHAAHPLHQHHPHLPGVANLFPFVPPGFMPQAPQAAHAHAAHAAHAGAAHAQPGAHPTLAAAAPGTGQAAPAAAGGQFFVPPNLLAGAGLGGFGGLPNMPGLSGAGLPGLPFPAAPTFAGLSDEEVRRMEGRERRAVIARVEALRNIQTLLDAATLQLQQYTSIMTALTSGPQFADQAASATSASGATSSQPPPTTPSDEKRNETNPQTQKAKTPEPQRAANGDLASSAAEGNNTLDSAEEIRQRRLQRFERPPRNEANDLD